LVAGLLGSRRICFRILDVPQGSHWTVVMPPLMRTPRELLRKCPSVSGPGCPRRRCHLCIEARLGGRSSRLRRLESADSAAFDSCSGTSSRTYCWCCSVIKAIISSSSCLLRHILGGLLSQ